MAEQAESQKVEETLNPNVDGKSQTSDEPALELESNALVAAESATITNNSVAETSAPISDADREKSLEYADELMEQGYKAMKENDFSEAAENFSRALEIRVAKFGELAPECVQTYYKYGCALLYKAQEEADPLADVPKKEDESEQGSTKDGLVKNSVAESSATSVSSNVEQDANSNNQDAALDDGQCLTSSVYQSVLFIVVVHFFFFNVLKALQYCIFFHGATLLTDMTCIIELVSQGTNAGLPMLGS